MNLAGKAVLFFLPVLFPALLFAQGSKSLSELSSPVLTPKPDSSEQKNRFSDRALWTENVSERTVFSSSYTTPDGRIITHYSKAPLNYNDGSGVLRKIVAQPSPTSGGWTAMEQPYPTYLFNDGSAAVSPSRDFPGEQPASQFVFGKNLKINGIAIAPKVPVMDGNVATIENIIPGVNKEFAFRPNGIKYNYVLNQPMQTQSGFLTISEELEIPDGYSLKRNEEHGRVENGGWCGDYQLISPTGEISAVISAPLCFDANKNFKIGTYKLKNENGHQILELLVPASWLNDVSRTYPITIDPLIIGPTAFWPGNLYMPSCIAPAFNSDSILVTIPAQICITGLIVTSSFYADPFTTAVMADGAMRFSTSCNTSQQFTIPLPGGNTPGTAYLDTFDLRNPLMCCFPQSCSQRTFYLRMHLSRTQPGSGCNITYIRHDPFTTLWPFQAFVEGRTAETYGQKWTVQAAPICSNDCDFTATAFMRYGVPPFTITHPWMANTITIGTPSGCAFGTTSQALTLIRPICPTFCDTTSLLAVPPPTITDACGNIVTGMPTKYLNLKNTPIVSATPNPDSLCSGEPVFISLTSCVPNSTITWSGNSLNGTGNILDTISNVGTSASNTSYVAVATSNGCVSDTLDINVVVDPIPNASFTNTDPIIAGVLMSFTNTTNIYAGNANFYAWDFGDTGTSFQENPNYLYNTPGTYTVCFFINTDHGCGDSICRNIDVIPAEIVAPNIITPNGDGSNDFLVFQYLEYYSNNHIDIFDRWGMLLYSQDHYVNTWDGSKYADGTYYYVLTIQDNGTEYHGFFQIIK